MPLKSVIKNCAVVLKCPFVIQNIDKIETLPIVGINALISSSSSVYITCLFIYFFFFLVDCMFSACGFIKSTAFIPQNSVLLTKQTVCVRII